MTNGTSGVFLKKGISKARLEPKAISAIKDGFDTRVSSSTARLKWINLKGKEFSQLSGWEEYFEPSYRACFDRCVRFPFVFGDIVLS